MVGVGALADKMLALVVPSAPRPRAAARRPHREPKVGAPLASGRIKAASQQRISSRGLYELRTSTMSTAARLAWC
jgi:hypothetical protein